MTTQNTHSQFLELPAELRLMIYSYALSSSQPVLASVISGNTEDDRIRIPKLYTQGENDTTKKCHFPQALNDEFNQLRYVCRTLCQETRGLSLRYNDFIFMSETETSARELCSQFLQAIPASAQARIQQIGLIEGNTKQAVTKASIGGPAWFGIGQVLTGATCPIIYAFCRLHPTAKVILRLNTTTDDEQGRPVPLMQGIKYTTLHAALRMFLRGSSAVATGVEEAIRTADPGPCTISQRHSMLWNDILRAEYRIALGMVPQSKSDVDAVTMFRGRLLENLRVTVSARSCRPRPMCVMEDEWFQTVRREFEEGC